MTVAFSVVDNKISDLEGFDYKIKEQGFYAKKLGPGPLSGYRCALMIGGVTLGLTEVNNRILMTGVMPDNTIKLVFPTARISDVVKTKCHTSFNQFCFMPGKLAYKIPVMGARCFSVALDLACLKRHLSARLYHDFIRICEQFDRYEVDVDQRAAFLQYLEFIYELLSASSQERLRESDVRELERELVYCLYDYLVSVRRSKVINLNRRGAIFFRALKIADQEAAGNLTVAELAGQVHVSIRTLQYIFADYINLSPKTCIRNLRMNAVRRQLLASHYAPGRVRMLANNFGIVHVSNFSASYKQLFGETPKDTLERMP